MALGNHSFCSKYYIDDKDDNLRTPRSQLGSHIELKDIPTAGDECLYKVVKERNKSADVTTCDKVCTKLIQKRSHFHFEEEPTIYTPDSLKPSKEWEKSQVENFTEIRQYLAYLKANKSTWPDNVRIINIQNTDWGWRAFFNKNESTLTCMLGLRTSLVDRGLQELIKKIEATQPGKTIDHKTGQWIYAFLACMNQPLLADSISILRDLARKCAEVRSRLNPADNNTRMAVIPLNMFITLVIRYFKQYDLAEYF